MGRNVRSMDTGDTAWLLMSTALVMIMLPGLALFLTTLAFNLVGDGLRDALDPRKGV